MEPRHNTVTVNDHATAPLGVLHPPGRDMVAGG
jgi:hypothetical protein